ncbi:Imm50 family immunity protein [Streptomyces sp. NPDC093109]|uniref:Imm50 family immunity protein n=1 Tax=Streptomyces sp. NPDC093109 TaxID=3154977 RepID=UPI00344C1E61
MTRPWIELVDNADSLTTLYPTVPPLDSVRVRSIHFNWIGPSLTLRMDLPEFPENIPRTLANADHDTFQCHLAFAAVDDLVLDKWTPPTRCDISFSPTQDHRTSVHVTGDGCLMSFSSSASLLLGHMSTFSARDGDGADDGPRDYLRRLDSRLFTKLPERHERTYYGHL